MDATDKVIVLQSLEALESAICADIKSRDVLAQRYCVRFIMLNNFDVFRDLTKFLAKEVGVEMFDLESLALGEDKTIDIDTLSDAIHGIKVTSLVTPFSELARFFCENEFKGFFNDVILTEGTAHPQKRIYIPIIGLHNRFTDFLKTFGRIEESAPIWQYYTPKDDKVMVYVSKYKDIPISEKLNICSLATMRDWLRFWKQQAPKDKILCGAAPILNRWRNSKPDSIFTFQQVDNSHEFISSFLELSLPVEYREDEVVYWDVLLESIGKGSPSTFYLPRYVEDYFNRKKLTANDILSIWANPATDAFGRWLLKAYALAYMEADISEYLRINISEIDELNIPNTLFVNVAERIFYLSSAEQERCFESRKELMREHRDLFRRLVPSDRQYWMKERIIEIAQRDEKLTQAKKMCTSTFDFENNLFLGWFLRRSDKDFGLSQIKEYFPELAGYLMPFDAFHIQQPIPWAIEYLRVFREAKISDTYSDQIKDFIHAKNASEQTFYDWYYAFEESHELLCAIQTKGVYPIDKIYWVDALGAEFIPYVHYLLQQLGCGYEVVYSQIARTTIPSNTHINSFDVDNKVIFKLDALDELAHEGHYQKYETFIRELEAVKAIVGQIVSDNKVGKHTIAIVSDHGLSALSRKCESMKIDSKTKHEGRYVPLGSDSEVVSDFDFVVHENERDHKKYKVALRHASLGTKPTHEVHGGATPEEVLVPFIVITNDDASKPIKYTVRPVDTKVPVSAKKVVFTIMPEPKSATVIFKGQTTALDRNGLNWEATIENATEGVHQLTVTPLRGIPTQVEIEFYGMGFGAGLDLDDF